MNLRKSILALSVVAGIVAAPMTVFAAHTHSWGSPQYYGYEDEMPGIYDDWDKCATRHVLILSILVYTFFSRMFDLMLPPVAKHSIVVA